MKVAPRESVLTQDVLDVVFFHSRVGGDHIRFGMIKSKAGFVYILADKKYGTLYIGSTDNLVPRIQRHKQRHASKFTTKYFVDHLVWYQRYESISDVRVKEMQMKKWNSLWKIRIIEEMNSNWKDLYLEAVAQGQSSPPARG